MPRIIIIMGSKADLEHSRRIASLVKEFGVECKLRIASAHKTPLKVLEILKEQENEEAVFITVAGRSNALSGLVDANTLKPVIACPSLGEKFAEVDLFSSLRMPSGVAPLVVLEPEQAALAALKILALRDKELQERIKRYQEGKREEVEKGDREASKM